MKVNVIKDGEDMSYVLIEVVITEKLLEKKQLFIYKDMIIDSEEVIYENPTNIL